MKRFAVLAIVWGFVLTSSAESGPRRRATTIVYPPVYTPIYTPVIVTPTVVAVPYAVPAAAPLTTVASPSVSDTGSSFQHERYLKIVNQTSEKLTVFLLYRSRDEKGQFSWMPASPGAESKAMTFEVEAGQSMDLTKKLSASRVRIWAQSPNMVLNENMNLDLWLVPETAANGEHRYRAADVQTFTVNLKSKVTVGDQ